MSIHMRCISWMHLAAYCRCCERIAARLTRLRRLGLARHRGRGHCSPAAIALVAGLPALERLDIRETCQEVLSGCVARQLTVLDASRWGITEVRGN